jgi:protein-S-isoprenylcysteine O-methyltransferase Ste14
MNEQSRALVRGIISVFLGVPLFFAIAMFWPAGTWMWTRGWIFVAVFMAATTLVGIYLWRMNPEIYVARTSFHRGTKTWNKILLAFLTIPMVAIFPVAALDDARFQWRPIPDWVCSVGYIMFFVGFGLAAWAEAVNKFFEPTVRIQTDRGQKVIDSGPYAIVRHPGYVSACLILLGVPLCLGSLWALIPGVISALIMILRTHWEDETLQAELTGYKQYAALVRYRLVPGVW